MTAETPQSLRDSNFDENRGSFMARIADLSLLDRRFVMFAYELTKTGHGHQGQMRESGQRYFEHPRHVALILIDELKIKDPELIAAALMHDVFEDTPIFGNAEYNTYQENLDDANDRIGRAFSSRVANIVIRVSSPRGSDIKILDDDTVDSMYHDNLQGATADDLIIKACDRLHNLRTLSAISPERQNSKVQETRDIYFPLFERIGQKYPAQYQYLMAEMTKAIDAVGLPK